MAGLGASWFALPEALAQAQPAAPRATEVRVSMSKTASAFLAEPRVRRLLEIELDGAFRVVSGFSGALGDPLVFVWVDAPSPDRAVVQVRGGRRPATERRLAIDPRSPDVAARFVAIAAAELVQGALLPERARTAPAPPRKSPEDLEREARQARVLELGGAGTGVFVPSSATWLGGSTLSIGLRQAALSERLALRWLGGSGDAGSTRWGEVATGLGYSLWLSDAMRLSFGAEAALGAVGLDGQWRVDGASWQATVRTGAWIAGELRLGPRQWLGVSLDPSLIVQPLTGVRGSDAVQMDGAFLGASVRITTELVLGEK